MAFVEAARITYGTPTKGLESGLKLREWLDDHCRDWRYEAGAIQGVGRWTPITVSMVLEEPVEKNKLANLVTQQVKRWGFQRQKNSFENFVVISIDSYADGPLGEKMRLRVGEIMRDIKERNRRQREERLKDFAQ